jgi:DNA-binding MarR family transcriptional regulator
MTGSRAVDRLGFLLARDGAITNARMRQALSLIGLTPRHGMALVHLAENGPMGQQALIEALGVDPSVLVALLNDLERDGLVQRRRDPADRRRHIVQITSSGSAAVAKVDAAITAVECDLFADLTEDEMTQLQRMLARVRTTPHDPAARKED